MRRGMRSVALPDRVEIVRARVAALGALEDIASGHRDAGSLESALTRLRSTAGSLPEGDVVWAYIEIAEALVHAVRWTEAAWNAEQDAERHATAARLRASQVLSNMNHQWPDTLHEAAQELEALENHDVPAQVATRLGTVPLPPRLTDLYRPSSQDRSFKPVLAETGPPAAAVLIRQQGEPVMRPTVVHPGALHQFEVEARVTEWPEEADTLEIAFLSVHPPDFLYASAVRFTKEALKQPLEIRVAGERPPDNPPLGLTAQAAFLIGDEPQATRLAGNTTLEIVTFDPGTALPLNMPTTALRLQQMMGELSNALPKLDSGVRRDAGLLLEAVLRFAHTVLDDRLGQHDHVDEKWFQREIQQFLQADPQIGARLGVHDKRAGGETDLVLGAVVLELKVETESTISLDEATERYVDQTTQYASAGDCQVSLLAVLDASPKRAPAGVMGNEMAWARPNTTSGQKPPLPSLVGVTVVRAGFPRPSDFSR